ncbi:MAG: DNA-3-methyladenine glycosylase [Vulcanimicrobiaceae bacterium]
MSEFPVTPPYRLDLTVAILRRLSTNLVDVVAPDGTYRRMHLEGSQAFVLAVRQRRCDALDVRAFGIDGGELHSHDDVVWPVVRRTLGVDRHAAHFRRVAAQVPWLAGIAGRAIGVRAPRYATLWEACVNAIVFQQVSLHAAGAILGRVLEALAPRTIVEDVVLRPFVAPAALVTADDATLRGAGLSVAKIATLRRVAAALADGSLRESDLEALPTPTAADRLCAIKGIGPWTAAVILLRGLGRLDVFPQNDSGVARSLRALTAEPVDIDRVLRALAPEQGMLYYHLLLARLEAAGATAATPPWL